MKINNVRGLKGEIEVPADKSISHRAIILSSLAEGTSEIFNFLKADDTLNTIKAFRNLGVEIEEKNQNQFLVKGKKSLFPPNQPIDVGNSGTTIRLLMGVLASQSFSATLTGDESIRRRPMKRVIEPLSLMGANIIAKSGNYAPIIINGGILNGITYELPIPSAQVKSAILLAGLNAIGTTNIIENQISRNHTELMLKSFGVPIKINKNIISIQAAKLNSHKITIPNDISSAAFFIVAALIIPESEIVIKNVGINPTRTGILDVINMMGGKVEVFNIRKWGEEEVADLFVRYQKLHGALIEGELIPRLIDEIPILAVLASQAEGTTIIRNAEELRVKESDRIKAIVTELKKMNVNIIELPDGMQIEGTNILRGNKVNSYNDHRITMALTVAGLIADNETIIDNIDSVKISYPNFFDDLKSLIK